MPWGDEGDHLNPRILEQFDGLLKVLESLRVQFLSMPELTAARGNPAEGVLKSRVFGATSSINPIVVISGSIGAVAAAFQECEHAE